jgi:uncharacterized protein YodC (DUF2158 family)
MTEWKKPRVGATVTLPSGGRQMTVLHVGGQSALCAWHDDTGLLQEKWIKIEALHGFGRPPLEPDTPALTHKGFSCVPDHAVQAAHFLSSLEALWGGSVAGFDGPGVVLSYVREYMDGKWELDTAISDMWDQFPECFPGLNKVAPAGARGADPAS